MAEFFQSRSLRYEIHVLVDGRWRIDETVGDDGGAPPRDRQAFEALEKSVIERANAMLAGGRVAAVKVIRERHRPDGVSTASELFFQEAPPAPKDPPLAPGRFDDEAPPCGEPSDLYRRDSCRAIGIVLRSFLDRLVVTPIELLHFAPYIRKLDENWSLRQAAVHQIAMAQARAGGETAGARAATLDRILDAAAAKAREAAGIRRLPAFEGDFQAWADAAAKLGGEADRWYHLHVALARHLQGTSSYFARLDFALSCLERPMQPESATRLDAFAAGCLDSSQLVMDLLGRQANLGRALLALADLAAGRSAAKGSAEAAERLNRSLQTGTLPECARAIWDRILRELSRNNPLCRNDERGEWDATVRLRDTLPERCPESLRERVRAALQRRIRRLRDAAA